MYVTSGTDVEQVLTLEAMIDFANAFLPESASPTANDAETSTTLDPYGVDTREVLSEAGFSRADSAPEAAIRRTTARMFDLLPRLQSLPNTDADAAVGWVNAELTEVTISPMLSNHDGAPLHIHWTPPSATFDDQVMADFLMALANELCDNGTSRFGRCAAEGCHRLFFDLSRNGSRRFCSDPRCASRTHTADHRKRKQRR